MVNYKNKLNKKIIPTNTEIQNLLKDFQGGKFDLAEKSALSMTKKFPKHDSPWYPTMRLYRQKNLNDWDSVFNKIMQDLLEVAKNNNI